jgi:hypothetical protein
MADGHHWLGTGPFGNSHHVYQNINPDGAVDPHDEAAVSYRRSDSLMEAHNESPFEDRMEEHISEQIPLGRHIDESVPRSSADLTYMLPTDELQYESSDNYTSSGLSPGPVSDKVDQPPSEYCESQSGAAPSDTPRWRGYYQSSGTYDTSLAAPSGSDVEYTTLSSARSAYSSNTTSLSSAPPYYSSAQYPTLSNTPLNTLVRDLETEPDEDDLYDSEDSDADLRSFVRSHGGVRMYEHPDYIEPVIGSPSVQERRHSSNSFGSTSSLSPDDERLFEPTKYFEKLERLERQLLMGSCFDLYKVSLPFEPY